VMRFSALPSRGRPYILIPPGRRSAATAVHHVGNPLRRSVRLAESALSAALATGLASPFLRDELIVSLPAADAPRIETLPERLGRRIGHPHLAVAVILGRDRPNRKPVLKLITPSGRCVAFAKLGWNAVTKELVQHEAASLRAVEELPERLRYLRVPSVLGRDEVGGVDVLVVTPMPLAGSMTGGPPVRLPVDATIEVSTIGERHVAWLRDDPYWKDVARRAQMIDRGVEGFTEVRDAVAGLTASYGDREVVFGGWHGDWTPWNMARSKGTLYVWDWERHATGVPIGMDAMHFDFDVRVKIHEEAPEDAVISAVRSQARMLEAMGQRVGLARFVMQTHLIEMVLRFADARVAGVPVPDAAYAPALRALRSEAVARA
jgi:hypothetical protein